MPHSLLPAFIAHSLLADFSLCSLISLSALTFHSLLDTLTKAPANDVSRHDQEVVSGYIFYFVVDVPAYSKVTTNVLLWW